MKGLVNTHVTAIAGANVTDVVKHLKEDDNTYKSIICCVGTNNCSAEDFNSDVITESYKDIITAAKAKVRDPKEIRIVSVPPRSDSEDHQENVDMLNTCLELLAQVDGVTFIKNDLTFKLSDGTPNDGYLLKDGLHLNNRGTNRIARNIKLKLGSDAVSENVAKSKKKQMTKSRPYMEEEQQEVQETNLDHAFWTNARQKASGRRPHSLNNRPRRNQDYPRRDSRCNYCMEFNHSTHECGFRKPAVCRQCFEAGHKQKFCAEVNQIYY